jgi:hypothetical protein
MKSNLYLNLIYFLKNVVEFLLLFLFFYIFIYLYNYSNTNTEAFSIKGVNLNGDPTKKIKESYRPYLRNARLYSEDFYNNTNNYINRFFRKTGLY